MIKFFNYDLETYLQGYLKKLSIDETDLANVKDITINSFDLSGKYISNSLEDLKLFKNLENLQLSNFILNRENISIIENLKNIKNYTFLNCDIKNALKISR